MTNDMTPEFKKAIEPLLVYYRETVVKSADGDREFKSEINEELFRIRGKYMNRLHSEFQGDHSYKDAEELVAKKTGYSKHTIRSILAGRK